MAKLQADTFVFKSLKHSESICSFLYSCIYLFILIFLLYLNFTIPVILQFLLQFPKDFKRNCKITHILTTMKIIFGFIYITYTILGVSFQHSDFVYDYIYLQRFIYLFIFRTYIFLGK